MYTYLIIDDEELIRKGTIKKLSSLKEQIACIGEAQNGADAIQKIEELHPDVVITDMQMPILNGTQLLPYLSEHYPTLPLIVISGYRDFDYMKYAISAQAIDYILKPFSKESICDCMRSAISRLKNSNDIQNQIVTSKEEKEAAYYEYDLQILKNLVMGYHTDTTSVSSHKLSFINNTHNIILLTLHFTETPPNQTISDWLFENGFGDLALYFANPTNPQMGFLILFIPEDGVLTNRQLTLQIIDALVSFLNQQNLSVIIGISQTHSDLKELHTAFKETSIALNQQKLVKQNASYYYYSEQKEPQIANWIHQDEFLFRIEAGMTKEVEKLTSQLFDWFLTIPDFTLSDAKYFCYSLSAQCRFIINSYLNQKDINSKSNSMQNVVNQIFTLTELKAYYMQFFLNIAELLKSQSVYAADDVVEKIQIYMQRNYQKNLTQEFISSLFYLNRSYLSTLFKAKTGQKFVDYLNEIRIEKSKDLLLHSERKMYQISKAVGYDNVKYFFRVFKKKVGVTPEQYRAKEF